MKPLALEGNKSRPMPNVDLDASGLSEPRTFTLPDKSGTLATTDDIAGGSQRSLPLLWMFG